MSIEDVLREMRRSAWKEMPLCGTVLRWADALEAAMREPVLEDSLILPRRIKILPH